MFMHQLFSRFFIQMQHFVLSEASFFDARACGAEKTCYFLTCNPAAQKKSVFFGLATLRRRKNPLFLDL
ncbi:hypothetical protein, partial [Segatella oulorum]|uniref:hypothetical protein n=1 Tax=Segatella oulorum TaxID=28136 RepID=UPI0023F561AE